jgi:hypothetical protein
MSKADAVGARSTYLNMIRGSGQPNATELINVPVQKLKALMDACSEYNIPEVSVMVVALRPRDIAHYRRMNPGSTASDNEIRGSQILVFRIPRDAFTNSAKQSGAFISRNPLMISLASAGLVLMDFRYSRMPYATDYYYFTVGAICPPPASCGD